MGYPAFCKPARLGSSVGISPVPGPDALAAALELAFLHDAKALVERAISGREVEVGVLDGPVPLASPVGEITFEGDWYDYETKYVSRAAPSVQVPADLPRRGGGRRRASSRCARSRRSTAPASRASTSSSADEGEVLLSELNTMPGFTPTSVYARLMEAAGIAYPDLVGRLIDLGIARAAEARRYRC